MESFAGDPICFQRMYPRPVLISKMFKISIVIIKKYSNSIIAVIFQFYSAADANTERICELAQLSNCLNIKSHLDWALHNAVSELKKSQLPEKKYKNDQKGGERGETSISSLKNVLLQAKYSGSAIVILSVEYSYFLE